MHSLTEAVAVECLATAFLLIGVVGSGIMAERLCGGNIGLALFANAIATGGALVALILAFGPRSGAHMNPAVTLAAALTGGLRSRSGGWVLVRREQPDLGGQTIPGQ
jgi:glycerol uptake facilitator-like aquaporin